MTKSDILAFIDKAVREPGGLIMAVKSSMPKNPKLLVYCAEENRK